MGRIWAVAKTTVSQAIRMKIALLFILVLLVVLPILSFIVTGDGSLKGKLQTFITYGMGLMNLLLCLLTIIIAAFTLSSDLKSSLLHTVVTKPIRRFELFIGKVLGIAVLDLMLLVVFGGLIYGLTLMIPKMSDSSPQEIEEANREFFTSRIEISPEPFDVDGFVAGVVERMKEENQFPNDPAKAQQLMGGLRAEVKAQSYSVPPGMSKRWIFEGLTPEDPNGSIYLRYKFQATNPPADDIVTGYWMIGDMRPLELGQKVNPYQVLRRDKNKMTHEIEIPASAVSIDGHLDAIYENDPRNNTTVIFERDNFKLLYRAGTFTMNFVKSSLIIFARMLFFAVLGVSLSTWLSFPVVILVSLSIFFTGMITGFIIESVEFVVKLEYLMNIVKGVIYLFPRFDGQTSPTMFMQEAREITWGQLGMIYLNLLFVKALIVGLIGIAVFSRREIAKVSV